MKEQGGEVQYFKSYNDRVFTAFFPDYCISVEIWYCGDTLIRKTVRSSSRLERAQLEEEASSKEEFDKAFIEANIRIKNSI